MENSNKFKNFELQPINGDPSGLGLPKNKPKRSNNKRIFFVLIFVVILIVVLAISIMVWYNIQLSPLSNDRDRFEKITISSGSSVSQIGRELQDKSIIRSAVAFELYVRISGKNDILQAGAYRLSPSESIPQIFDHFVKGTAVDTFNITFLPGATLSEHRKVLQEAGFSDSAIDQAFSKKFSGPLFAGKPASADLEGYIYGETYNFNSGASVEDVLQRTFDEFYEQIKHYNLEDSFMKKDLTLFQAITLASIIQREVSGDQDQKQVAQVFFSRLANGMLLGSDVTYQYIADKTGQQRSTDINSPYNTRKFPGLPPGPISSPGLGALRAVASPADGEYLYFLSGDDDKTYFAKTDAEHESNIIYHCQKKCLIQ